MCLLRAAKGCCSFIIKQNSRRFSLLVNKLKLFSLNSFRFFFRFLGTAKLNKNKLKLKKKLVSFDVCLLVFQK